MRTIILHATDKDIPMRLNIDDISRYGPAKDSAGSLLCLRSTGNQVYIIDESATYIDQLISNCNNY